MKISKEKLIPRKSAIERLSSYINDEGQINTVLNINGIGGVGKSILINEFAKELQNKDICNTLVDGKQDGIKSLVINQKTICNLVEFSKYIAHYEDTDKIFKEFNDTIQHFESISIKYSKYLSTNDIDISPYEGIIESSIGGAIGTLVAGIPGAILGAALGGLSGKTLKYFGREANRLLNIGFSESDAKFCISIEKEISRTLILGINRIIETKGKFVLFIDSFDEIKTIKNWLFNDFLGNINNVNLKIIIASRCHITGSNSIAVESLELQPFTFEESIEYFNKKNLSKDDMEKIYSISKGIPWMLSLIQSSDYLKTSFCGHNLESFQFINAKKTVDYILDNIKDDKLKKLVEFSSITPSFNLDLISYCFNDIENTDTAIDDLFSLSFVKQLPDGKHYVSDTVRELVINYLLIEKPLLVSSWNKKIEQYYRELMQISPYDTVTKYLWDYLSSYYFDDLDARQLFLPSRICLNDIDVIVPKLNDLEQVYEIDYTTMGFDPEFEYTLSDLQKFYNVDLNNFSIASDVDSNRITGYSLLLKPDREWCKSFEACQEFEIHPNNLLAHSTNNIYNDYLIDTIAVNDLYDKTSTYILMRDILNKLKKPRKIYTLAITKYGVNIARKLGMNYLQTITSKKGNPLECYYLCLYNTVLNSPIHTALQKKCKPITEINPCLGCMIPVFVKILVTFFTQPAL